MVKTQHIINTAFLSVCAIFFAACIDEEGQSYSLSAIDDQTFVIQEEVNIITVISPAIELEHCESTSLPNGLSIAIGADNQSCVISGKSTELFTETEITITALAFGVEKSTRFSLVVNNATPDLPAISDKTFVLGQTISSMEYISTAGIDITSCGLQDRPSGVTIAVNATKTGCLLSGTPSELIEIDNRYLYAINAEGYDLEYFNYEVVRPNTVADLQDGADINAVQDNAIADFTFDNDIGGGNLISCSVYPPLPAGLSIEVSDDQVSCTIKGTATELIDLTSYTVRGDNAFGMDTAVINIGVSRDSARLSVDQGKIKAFGFSWNTVLRADHYSIYEKKEDEASYTLLSDFTQPEGSFVKHLSSLFPWPNTEYYIETCFDAMKTECIDSDVKTISDNMKDTIGYFKSNTSDIQDQFGAAVALSGDGTTMAVCAPNEESGLTGINADESDNSSDNAGAVYIYVDAGNNNWSQQAYIKADSVAVDDRFCGLHLYRPRAALRGLALSDDGNTLAVGASGAEAVYVFERSGSSWSQVQKLTAEYADDGDLFGQSIDMNDDGSKIIIGAPYEDCRGVGINSCDGSNDSDYNYGAAYLFDKDAMTGDWSQTLYIKNPIRETGSWFGYSVAMADDGETFAVSEFFGENLPATSGQLDSGLVHIYNYDTMGDTWTADTNALDADNRSSYARFGTAMDFNADGTMLAVGAFAEDSAFTGIEGLLAFTIEDNNGAGAAYVFERADKLSAWSQMMYVKPEYLGIAQAFGIAIELSDDGSDLFVGASGDGALDRGLNGDLENRDDFDMSFMHGAVYHYQLNAGLWTFANHLKATNNTDGHDVAFGYDIALSNDVSVIAIGAPGDSSRYTGIDAYRFNSSNNFAGAVHLY